MKSFRTNGFTLIELLVVVVLLGIVTSMAVLTTGSSGIERELDENARRLHSLIKLVREEAIIQAKEIAMEIDNQNYLFLELEDKKWLPLENKIFRQRSLLDELKLQVELETESQLFKTKKSELLRLFFLSSGEQTPFEIKLSIKGETYPYYKLIGMFNGDLKLEHINDPING